MAGLVPAIPLRRALSVSKRGHRDKPGDDKLAGMSGEKGTRAAIQPSPAPAAVAMFSFDG